MQGPFEQVHKDLCAWFAHTQEEILLAAMRHVLPARLVHLMYRKKCWRPLFTLSIKIEIYRRPLIHFDPRAGTIKTSDAILFQNGKPILRFRIP